MWDEETGGVLRKSFLPKARELELDIEKDRLRFDAKEGSSSWDVMLP